MIADGCPFISCLALGGGEETRGRLPHALAYSGAMGVMKRLLVDFNVMLKLVQAILKFAIL